MAVSPQTTDGLIALLRGLRAVREFRPDPVPTAVVDDLLEVARWTGSARNRQPWEIVVVREPATLRALAAVEGYADHLAGASLGMVLVMAGDPKEVAQETYDEGRLAERIMLAAAAHGVGASICWFFAGGAPTVGALLGIPDGKLVRTAISIGYPAGAVEGRRPKRPDARKELVEIVHDERYGQRPADRDSPG